MELTRLEKEIIEDILIGKIHGITKNELDSPTVAFAVWQYEGDRIQFGRVRWGYKNNYITNDGKESSLSCSPFSGSWSTVPVSRIIRIRSVGAF